MVSARFLDSSALVKRYVQEAGTARVRRVTRHGPSSVMYIARVTVVEVSCAIARRRKGKTLTARRASTVLRRFRQHLVGRYVVTELTTALFDDATRLGLKHFLRAYDAVQLAAALEVDRLHRLGGAGRVTLVSADHDLNAAAIAEGLLVDNPTICP